MRPRSHLLRLLKLLAIIELLYLLVFNGLLWLPATQTIASGIKPDKFRVSWDRAWTWYPFRLHATGVFANGQSRSQQWQVQADAASGSVSLLPLVLKRVYVRNVDALNIRYRQRPRLKADRDYAALLPYFPDIDGREISAADTTPFSNKRPWQVSVRNARASGRHEFHIFNVSGSGEGGLVGDLHKETRGGPLSMEARDIDLMLGAAHLNGEEELFRRGRVTGQFAFTPFVPRNNHGIRMLDYLILDADLDLDVNSLGFLNLFTANFGDLHIGGAGEVAGRVKLDRGYAMAGTDLAVEARDLTVRALSLAARGDGTVRITATDDAATPLVVDIDYNDLSVSRGQQGEPFIVGENLELQFAGSNYVKPDPGLTLDRLLYGEQARAWREVASFTLRIDAASMTDLSILNDYLLTQTPMEIAGGSARLDAEIVARLRDVTGGLSLKSTDLDLRFDDQAVAGDLDLDVVLSGGVLRERQFDISGSSLKLDQLRVVGARDRFEEDGWSANITLDRATTSLQQPPRLDAEARFIISDTGPVVALFNNYTGAPLWLAKLLTFRDIEGSARFDMADNRLFIPVAHATSDVAEVGAKGAFSKGEREGVAYARYRKLDAVLKVSGGERNIDVIKAREKYDAYRPHR